jgi:heat shock protein HtpX
MLILTLLLIFIGGALGGKNGMIFALIFAFFGNMFFYWFSDKIVLMMHNAKEIKESDAPLLYKTVRNLSTKMNIPMPKVYIIPMDAPNAFATGRNPNHAVVAVSPSIMNLLTHDEMEAVIAHELTHIKNRDILIATIAASIAGAISHLAYMARWAAFFGGIRDDEDNRGNALAQLFLMLIAPIAATLIQLAISRSREYAADAGSAYVTNRPYSLISALKKIHEYAKVAPLTEGNYSTASLFIVNPFKGDAIINLFSTHPTLNRRIANLEKIARKLTGIFS